MYIYHGIAIVHHVLEPQLQAACLAIVRYQLTTTKSRAILGVNSEHWQVARTLQARDIQVDILRHQYHLLGGLKLIHKLGEVSPVEVRVGPPKP